MTAPASIAEDRKKKTEEVLISILRSKEAQVGWDIDDILHNLKKKIDPDVELNREIIKVHLGPLISEEKVTEGILGDESRFFWNHYRGLCHVIVEGHCKCCGENADLFPKCPNCPPR